MNCIIRYEFSRQKRNSSCKINELKILTSDTDICMAQTHQINTTAVRCDCIELNLTEENIVMNNTAAPDNSYVKKFRLDLHLCFAAVRKPCPYLLTYLLLGCTAV
jgi:hypothetical protein